MQNLILNRYRPLEAAGEGGFATVLAAWDTRIQRRVAIKCLRLDGCIQPADPHAPREIPGLEEARTAAMLSSPHIVNVLDFDMYGPQAYLIMEYMDGITLTQLMRQEGPLPLDVVTCVFEAVADALETAHENQVLHLDIKPDNVLINRQGQVKVADFGLAQLSHAAGFASAAGGTIGYMPLEQMRLEACDARTDEWALAALTYQMLTGENPFIAPDLASAERAIETAEVVIPSAARVDVGEEVDEALFGALAINREDRFDSVALFADAMLPNLGDARRGARELAVIVGEACDDYVEEDDATFEPASDAGFEGRLSLMDRLGSRAEGLLMRVWGVAACGVAGVVAATNIPQCMSVAGRMEPAFWLVVGACVAAAAVWPGAGAAVALAALVAALGFSGSPVLAALLGVFGAAWLVMGGFRRHAAANVGTSIVTLGAIGAGPVVALLAGYFLNAKKAAAASAFAVVAAFCLACAGSADLTGWNALVFGSFPGADSMNATAIHMATTPSTWVVAATWVLGAIAGALLCSRDNRGLAALGVAAATTILALGVVAAARIGGAEMPDIAQLAPVLLGGVALACACIAGVPRREGPARYGYSDPYFEGYPEQDEETY